MKNVLRLVALLGAFCSVAPAATAAEREFLGWGRMFANDTFGDGYDRWRTGSYTISVAWGPAWEGQAPAGFGELLEFRTRSELIAPSNLVNPRPNDRRFVGALSFGLHSHSKLGAADLRAGVDITLTGPQTGLGELQDFIHTSFGLDESQVLDDQHPDNIYATLSAELGRELGVGNARLRPFLELQAGVENFARIGADLTFGSLGQGALMARDSTTGHRYQVVRSSTDRGLSLVLGADVAQVYQSAWLPEDEGFELEETRTRVRAGVNWQGDSHGVYYGLTYLSEEFEAQPEGQLVGAVQLRLFF